MPGCVASTDFRHGVSAYSGVLARMLEDLIAGILERECRQLSYCEYRYVAELVVSRGGCNFLVFGSGNDSKLRLQANQLGRTVFLESAYFWSRRLKFQEPDVDVRAVSYGTRRDQWRELLNGPTSDLTLALPGDVEATQWDVIFVDAPAGYNASCPGRMKSIYTAADLGRRARATDVLVHDCDREVERMYCDVFLGQPNLVRAFDRTRHYKLGTGTT